MASDAGSITPRLPMTSNELIAFVKNELDADEERQAPVSATAAPGEQLPTGSTLDLSHKNIGALPVEVILLIKDKVERLALSHNPRISLPLEIGQCDRLRYLNLRWNKLKHFPDAVLSLSKLEILDISKNFIDGIPEDIKNMTNLKFLAVARNQIKRLPFALGEMNLVKLKFDENPIEFPPLDSLKPPADRAASMIESEKDKDMCQQVKRFMKAAALRERLKSTSEEDLSESNVETPKPPKRSATGGRFPVRPSISGMEAITGVSTDSPPDHPPPIPQRSHARGISTNMAPPTKRPGITPLLTGSDASRSRSETVATSANIKNRRQGYVPRKNTGMSSLSEMSTQLSARTTGQTPALTPPHSRAPSVTSSYGNYLGPGSGGESSGAVSPVDGPISRSGLSRRLASLPESRNSTLPTINSTKAVKRVLFMLFYLYKPLSDIVQKLALSTPKKSALERQLYTAQAHVEELDRLITSANSVIEDNAELDPALLASIVRSATTALKSYVSAIKAVGKSTQKIIKEVDPFHARFVMNIAYSTILESRNICYMLGFTINTKSVRDTLRVSQAWSSRTVTPTQLKAGNSIRRRGGATVLPHGSVSNLRGMPGPVPLNSGSRTNTMTSMSSMATPRFNESFTSLPSSQSTFPSRSNTMRSVTTESDHDEGPDRMYLKLKSCCDLASQSLPPVRTDLATRKVHTDASGQSHASRYYAEAVHKCDMVIATNNKLQSKLKMMKVGDAVRYQRDFSQMTESFGRDWTNFVTTIVELNNQRIDIGNIRRTLKPLQSAVKDANRIASQPPQQQTMRPPPTASLHGSFLPALNTSVAQASGPVTPVPVTPLGAALGPAVQATVPPTPTTAYNSPEYNPMPTGPPRMRAASERTDNMLPLPSYPRRQ